MTTRKHKPLIAFTAALIAALAVPAIAQSTTTAEDSAAATQPQQTEAAEQPTAHTSDQSSAGHQSWASVDTDGDGAISKQEAQVNAGLAQIFDQADSNGDGKLTAEEYKAFVAKQQSGATAAPTPQQN